MAKKCKGGHLQVRWEDGQTTKVKKGDVESFESLGKFRCVFCDHLFEKDSKIYMIWKYCFCSLVIFVEVTKFLTVQDLKWSHFY